MPSSSNMLKANRLSIAVYAIYKNEQNHIKRFLDSVQSADEIVLCDTGSNDKTNAIIQQYKKSNSSVNVRIYSICVSPWRFDDARNTSLALVGPDIDLCLAMDIDEYLLDGWKQHLIEQWEPACTRYNHKFKTIWPGENVSEHWHERIHIRSGYTWKLPVHEILEYNGQETRKWLPDFWIYHQPDLDKTRSNYLPLLEQSVKERKNVWKSWCFLAHEYLSAQRYGEALQALDNALDLPDSDKYYIFRIKYLIYKATDQVEFALLSLDQAIAHMPRRREPYFEKALYLHQLGRNVEAYCYMKQSEKIMDKIIDYNYNPAAWDIEFKNWRSDFLSIIQKEGIDFA